MNSLLSNIHKMHGTSNKIDLNKEINKNIPIIPKLPNQPEKVPFDLNPIVGKCGECGYELRKIENYCCMKNNCPCFKKVMY